MSSTKSAFGKNKLKNVKALLKLYRKVLYSVNNNLYYLDEEVYVNSRRHLSDLVDSLVEFETREEKRRFDDRVNSCHKSLSLLELLDKTIVMVRDYPDKGRIYYDILFRYYFDNFSYTHASDKEDSGGDMAVTKIHRITTTLSKALDYIENKDKTDDTLLVTGYACSPEIADMEFDQVRRQADKPGGTLAFHLIQSFAPGETDYETAHKIGVELADRILKNRFQYVIATHIDKGHIHNHIIFNSVSFKDHGKFHSTASLYRFIRRTSDILCTENGLSVISEPKEKGKSHYEHLLDKRGQSWKSKLRQTIDLCVLKAKDWDEFLRLMEKEKYEIKYGKYISFRAEGQERFTRSKTLGEKYTEENLRKRIAGEAVLTASSDVNIGRNLIIDIENNIKAKQSVGYANWARKHNLKLVAETINYLSENNIPDLAALDVRIAELSDQSAGKKMRVKAAEKRIKVLEEQINDIVVYRKTKPVVEGVPKVFGAEKYRHEHEADFILYAAAEKSLKKQFGGEKLPLIKELRAEQRKLKAEIEKLKSDIRNEKPQLDELKNMRRNIEMFLGDDGRRSQGRQNKRSGELE